MERDARSGRSGKCGRLVLSSDRWQGIYPNPATLLQSSMHDDIEDGVQEWGHNGEGREEGNA
jgi:hypothetical protein